MIPNYNKLHVNFKLNGMPLTYQGLKEVAHNFVKAGVLYEQLIGEFLLEWLDESATITVSTSGSTGDPKCIMLNKGAMVYSAIATGSFFKLKPGDSALLCLPCNYIAGKMMLVRAMILGLHIELVPPSTKLLVKNKKRFDFAAVVPMQLEQNIENINAIKTVIVGGAKVSEQLISKIRDVQASIFETYGMTETITHIAVRKLNNYSDLEPVNFIALPEVTLSQDERGCLIIDAPLLTKELIITNDIVNLINKKEFNWLGRYDNVINSGGVKLFPEQIEIKLSKEIHSRFFITAIEDKTLGEAVTLVIEGEKEICDIKFCGLNDFEKPKYIFKVDKFIETGSGKIQRAKTLSKAILSKK